MITTIFALTGAGCSQNDSSGQAADSSNAQEEEAAEDGNAQETPAEDTAMPRRRRRQKTAMPRRLQQKIPEIQLLPIRKRPRKASLKAQMFLLLIFLCLRMWIQKESMPMQEPALW